MDDCILKTYGLSKKFKKFSALKDVNVTVNRGDIYGFLGENGAGKTTFIRTVLGLMKPSSGEINLFGKGAVSENRELLKRIGSIIEYPGFYNNLTAKENLEIHRRMMGIQDKNSIENVLKSLGLIEVKEKKVKEFSLGMKQRLGIARAIMHNPEFLILDEPTNGLDPSGIREMRELIIDLHKKYGITFLISSHILSEVQQMATKIGIIHKGKLMQEITYNELQKRNRHYINLKVNDEKRTAFVLEEKLKVKDYILQEKSNFRIYEGLENTSKINKELIKNNIEVEEICVKVDNLEDYFLELTRN